MAACGNKVDSLCPSNEFYSAKTANMSIKKIEFF